MTGERTIASFRGEHAFLSNFYPVEVQFDGVVYPTVEHAFQAAKTVDADERDQICQQMKPLDAKRLGQDVKLRDDWETKKIAVMEDLVLQKFQRPVLRARLLATGDAALVEGNTWGDTFWGVSEGKGANHLGRILMRIREYLIHS